MSTFQILLCTNESQYILGDEGVETLNPGETWAFSGANGQLICGTVVEAAVGVPNYTAVTLYDGCGECLEDTLTFVTAGTPYETCVICCPCNSGTTVNSVSTPHPIWTGINGQVVTQGSAVQLGGQNGLYS